jgi:hypothetical protein
MSPAARGTPIPISALINEIGQGNCTGSGCAYPVFPAARGSCQEGRTMMRIINTSGFAVFTLMVGGGVWWGGVGWGLVKGTQLLLFWPHPQGGGSLLGH